MFKNLALKLLKRIDDLPLVDLIPLFIKAFESLPEEEKIESLQTFFKAAVKKAKEYAEKE